MRINWINRLRAGALWAASLGALVSTPSSAQFVGYQSDPAPSVFAQAKAAPVNPYQNVYQGAGYQPVPGPLSGQAPVAVTQRPASPAVGRYQQPVPGPFSAQAAQTPNQTPGRYGQPTQAAPVAQVAQSPVQPTAPVQTFTTPIQEYTAAPQTTPSAVPHSAQATSGVTGVFDQSASQYTTPQYTAMNLRRAQPTVGDVTMPLMNDPAMQGGQPMMQAGVGQPMTGQPGCSTCETGAGCATGTCGVGCDGSYGGYLKHCKNPCRQWFGGVYGLFMERNNTRSLNLAYATSTANGAGYYPHPSEIVLSTRHIDYDFQGGAEVRFGCTFGGGYGGGLGHGGLGHGGGCDGCCGGGCGGCCCGPRWAWEGAYWGLAEEDNLVYVDDFSGDAWRTYGMHPWVGSTYDAGAGARPLNDYYDYGNPIGTNDVEIRRLSLQTRFSMQNAEINLIKLPQLCCGCGQRCSISSVFGFRFLRFDDDLWYRSDWENTTTSATGYVQFHSEVENQLYGAQWGCNGVYHLGCSGKWALHCNTVVGLFANDMEVVRYFTGGDVVYSNEGTPTASTVSDEDFAMLGEIRAGISFRPWCHCRLYGGWRAIGISGVATSVDQIPNELSGSASLGYVNNDGALIVHGLQTGVEFMF